MGYAFYCYRCRYLLYKQEITKPNEPSQLKRKKNPFHSTVIDMRIMCDEGS